MVNGTENHSKIQSLGFASLALADYLVCSLGQWLRYCLANHYFQGGLQSLAFLELTTRLNR
jgi:hypothetical protein